MLLISSGDSGPRVVLLIQKFYVDSDGELEKSFTLTIRHCERLLSEVKTSDNTAISIVKRSELARSQLNCLLQLIRNEMLNKPFFSAENIQALRKIKIVFRCYTEKICNPELYEDIPEYPRLTPIITYDYCRKIFRNKHIYPPVSVLSIEDGLGFCRLPENNNHQLFTIVEVNDPKEDLITFIGSDRKKYMSTAKKCSIISFFKNESVGWEFVSASLSHVLWIEANNNSNNWHFKLTSALPFTHCHF